jgi:hypothetical protein
MLIVVTYCVCDLQTKLKSVQLELTKAKESQDQLKVEADKAKQEMQQSLQEVRH